MVTRMKNSWVLRGTYIVLIAAALLVMAGPVSDAWAGRVGGVNGISHGLRDTVTGDGGDSRSTTYTSGGSTNPASNNPTINKGGAGPIIAQSESRTMWQIVAWQLRLLFTR